MATTTTPPLLRAYLGFSAVSAPLWRLIQRRRIAAGKEDAARAGERWGRSDLARPPGPLVWFHAASVGESLSLVELITRLLAARPAASVLVTTGTRTSAGMMAGRLPERARHQFLPYDTPGAVRAFLDHWRPDLAVWTESEIWPRLLVGTTARRIPAVLVNARLSPRSARAWARWPRLARALFGRFDAVLVPDAATAGVLGGLGVAPARLAITGSLKEAAAPPGYDPAALEQLRRAIGARPLWLAASTHPGEEAVALAAAEAAFGRGPEAPLLLLVPRHPERGPGLADEARAAGWRVARRGAAEPLQPDTQVYLADTLGEMGLWYRLAPVAFVGGSIAPMGGHNPYEPAALGAAILHGPEVFNFAGAYAKLAAAGAARPVRDAAELAAGLRDLFRPGAAAAMADAARVALAAETGAAAGATLDALLPLLDAGPAGGR